MSRGHGRSRFGRVYLDTLTEGVCPHETLPRGVPHLKFVGWLLLLLTAASTTTEAGQKRVLILYSFGRSFAPYNQVASSFQTELAQLHDEPIQFPEASVMGPQFLASQSGEPIVAYLRALFPGDKPDLIVPFGAPANVFVLRHRAQLFPTTPLLLAAVDERHLQTFTLDAKTTAVPASFDFPAVAEDFLRLWPGTTNLVTVQGQTALENFWKTQIQRELAPFTNRLALTWLDNLTMKQMLESVGRLPPHSVILYHYILVDAAGVPYEDTRALNAIHASANAPIVGLFEEELGLGLVGGRMLSLRDLGRKTAVVAARILKGESPGSLQIQPMKVGPPSYDWRELRRWGIDPKQLPPGSEVRFRPPAFAQQYRWQILGALATCLIEAVLILALLRQLRRRREIERALRYSEERMKLAASAAGIRVWEWDMGNGHISTTSGPPAARMASGELAPSDYASFLRSVHPADRDQVTLAVAKSKRGDCNYESVHRVLERAGRTRWIAERGRVEFGAKHEPLRMRGVSMDITNLKEAELRAQESERRFLQMANSSPILMWTSGPDKLCTFVNQTWLKFTGRTLEQDLGNGWAEGIHPEDVAASLKVYMEAFDHRLPFTMEYRLRRHDGEYRWLFDHGVPRYDGEQNFLGYIGSCTDITERKQAESEAQLARQELTHMGRVSTLGLLTGSLAHELNQPLTAILSNAQAAQRYLSNGHTNLTEVVEILQDIVTEDRRAGEIISRLRSMLKKGEVKMSPLDINSLIGDVLGLVRGELALRRVNSTTRLAPALPPVLGDRVQLQQVMINLVVNACEAMSANPEAERRLTIQTEQLDAHHVQMAVRDEGPGFDPEGLKRVFEPFHSTKTHGLGLGLPICRSIITSHHGRIWAANNDGKGATLSFTLQIAPKEGP